MAKQNGFDTITLSKGTFEEDDLLVDFSVRIQGGFSELGGQWSAQCDAARRTLTSIRAKTKSKSIVVTAGAATLESLTVTSRTTPAVAGESLYGVFATGASTKLSLLDVKVDVADAGDAAPTAKAADGVAALSPGNCAASSGAVGANGNPPTSAANVAIGATGAVNTDGKPGEDGKPGSASAKAATVCTNPCSYCYSLRTTDPPYEYTCYTTGDYEPAVCHDPLVGCGGGAGKAGPAGRTGGSSFGVFAWDALVTITASELSGGGGGNGSDGGLGGTGAQGSADPKSKVACSEVGLSNCSQVANYASPGCEDTSGKTVGAPRGGRGGDGSRGGGGAGGHSYGVYVGGGGKLTQTGSKIAAGSAGKGGVGATQASTGPGGIAKPVGP